MEEYKLTMTFEAPDRAQAIKLADDATDAVPVLHYNLEVKFDNDPDPPVWDEVEY